MQEAAGSIAAAGEAKRLLGAEELHLGYGASPAIGARRRREPTAVSSLRLHDDSPAEQPCGCSAEEAAPTKRRRCFSASSTRVTLLGESAPFCLCSRTGEEEEHNSIDELVVVAVRLQLSWSLSCMRRSRHHLADGEMRGQVRVAQSICNLLSARLRSACRHVLLTTPVLHFVDVSASCLSILSLLHPLSVASLILIAAGTCGCVHS
jgi:hypothetical protein